MARRPDPSLLARLLLAVRRWYEGAAPGLDDLPTGLPWLGLVRRRTSAGVGRGMLQPSVCLLVQGEKEILVGQRVLRYGSSVRRAAAAGRPVDARTGPGALKGALQGRSA
jgi:hypothetical protein